MKVMLLFFFSKPYQNCQILTNVMRFLFNFKTLMNVLTIPVSTKESAVMESTVIAVHVWQVLQELTVKQVCFYVI